MTTAMSYRHHRAYLFAILIGAGGIYDAPRAEATPSRDNTDILQAWYGDSRPQTVYKYIKAGVYYPIRVLSGQEGVQQMGTMEHAYTSPRHSPKSDDITLMWFGDEQVKYSSLGQ